MRTEHGSAPLRQIWRLRSEVGGYTAKTSMLLHACSSSLVGSSSWRDGRVNHSALH